MFVVSVRLCMLHEFQKAFNLIFIQLTAQYTVLFSLLISAVQYFQFYEHKLIITAAVKWHASHCEELKVFCVYQSFLLSLDHTALTSVEGCFLNGAASL